MFCRKQVTRQLINRPATRVEVNRKDEKEKIIVFRDQIVKKFNQKKIKKLAENFAHDYKLSN